MNGWVSLHRKVFENPIIKPKKPYTKFEAWCWLIIRANHTDTKFVLGTEIIKAKAGEVITSQKKLGLQFGWGNTKIRNFLKLLENDSKIAIKTTAKTTRISITNYCELQETQTKKKSKTNRKQNANKLMTNTINNKNNSNNVNNKDIKSLNSIDKNFIEELQLKHLDVDVKCEFDKFKDYLSANGKTYKDYRAAFRNWLRSSYTPKTDAIKDKIFREKKKADFTIKAYTDEEIATPEERRELLTAMRKIGRG